jgi:hypothetical protein
MRYERMLLAAIASAVFLFLGLHFASMTMQAAAAVPSSWAPILHAPSLRLLSFAAATGVFLSFGLAFLCFALIKVEFHNKLRYVGLFARVRNTGILLVWAAFASAGFWFAANAALHLVA